MNTDTALPSTSTPSPANIQLMQLTTACWTSRCLHVIAELGIADLIGDQPQSTDALAKSTGTQPQPLYRVLRLLASVGIFEWKHGVWHHTDASRFLRSDHPESLRDYVRMLGLPAFWSAFGYLDHSLRTGKSAFAKHHPEGVFGYLASHPEESRIFDAAMTSKSHRDIAAILPAYDFSRFGTIADIAGGRGHLLRAILKSSPKTQGILFDQPHVVAGVTPEKGEKLAMVGGDFFADAMPRADAYLLMNVIHDWPDAESIKNPVRHPARHAASCPSADYRDRCPTYAWAASLEGTRHCNDGTPRWHGAHSGGIRRVGFKICSSIGACCANHEPIFNPGNGRRLKAQRLRQNCLPGR